MQTMLEIEQNHVLEIDLTGPASQDDLSADLELDVAFTAPDGKVRRVPAFRTDGGQWKVRYSSNLAGRHTFRTAGQEFGNGGLGLAGACVVVPYAGDNPLYRHGAIGRHNNDLYLTHQDGRPFFWLADTWWMGLTSRLAWPDGFQSLLADRAAKGFSVIQIVAGLYPDMLPFDQRGSNEAGFPWDESFQNINAAYFDLADRRIACLAEQGMTPCIVGSWGFFMKFAGKKALRRHWRNLIARWAAWPVAWCVAGEANMAFYDDNLSAADHLKQSRRDWNDLTQYIRQTDPFNRLVTIHPTRNGHEQIEDETLLDLDMLQTGHGGPTSIVPTMRQLRLAIDRRSLPVINAEVCYEGICGSSYADVQRYIFLSNLFLGACGHTYGANGIWQVNTAEQPYGASPHGAHWGSMSWQDASRLPGSLHIGLCKKYLTRFAWWRFERHPEWIEQPCSGEAMDGHFAMGIPGEVRLFFKPNFGGDFWGSVEIRHIEPDIRYRAERMNPITGEVTDLGPVAPDAAGSWRMPRVDAFQDWIYALVRTGTR